MKLQEQSDVIGTHSESYVEDLELQMMILVKFSVKPWVIPSPIVQPHKYTVYLADI